MARAQKRLVPRSRFAEHSRPIKVSVVTVVWNDESGLLVTLDSLRGQDYPHVEHIIIDGGSTDGTLGVISENKLRDTVLVSEPDDGIYDAMNKGLALATGDVIGFLNAADLYASATTVTMVVRSFEQTDTDAVYGDVSFFDDQQRIVRRWRAGTYRRWKMYLGWAAPHPAFFVRSSIFRRVGIFDPSLRNAGDYEFMLRCFLHHGVHPQYLGKELARMKIGGFSHRSIGNIMLGASEVRRAWIQNKLRFGFLAPWGKPLSKIPQILLLKGNTPGGSHS